LRTAVAAPEPERRRNEPIVWTSTTTTADSNAIVKWVRIDSTR
jgi:hypothetical protein